MANLEASNNKASNNDGMRNLLIISDYQPLGFIMGRPVSVVILICIIPIIAFSFKKNKSVKEE